MRKKFIPLAIYTYALPVELLRFSGRYAEIFFFCMAVYLFREMEFCLLKNAYCEIFSLLTLKIELYAEYVFIFEF